MAAANEEADCAYGGNHFDSDSDSHHTIPPTIDWNDDKGDEYDNEYDNEFEYDDEYDEYDSDNKMYTKNDTIINRIFEDISYIENNTIHTTNNTNMNTIIKIPTLTQPTNRIIKSSIYSEINIIDDKDEDDPNNSIKGKNAAKKKEKHYNKRKQQVYDVLKIPS